MRTMNGIRQLTTLGWIWAAVAVSAAGPDESSQFFFGAKAYPADILDAPRPRIDSEYPELLRPPAIGETFTFRICRGTNPVREIAGTVVSSNVLECADGPEISLHDDLRLDLLRALYLTDILHRSPQIIDAETPVNPRPPPFIEILEPRPRLP